MSGIPIHTEDPISPAEASGVTPQTAYNSNAITPSQPAKTTAPSPYAYPPARPGAAAPTPTRNIPQSSSHGPPAPQPGAAPMPPPPTITAQPSLPPPPKAGEKASSSEHYAPVRSTPAQPQPYPPQMSQPTVDPPFQGLPPASTTSTSMRPSFDPSAPPGSVSSPPDMPIRASLEHPPGYVQNPFASDMTPDQRFAADGNRSGTLPSLGYTDNAQVPRPGSEEDRTAWGTAKKWAMEKGERASKLGEEVWEKFGAEK